MGFPEIILLRHSSTIASNKNIISGWCDDRIDEDKARNEIEKLINDTRRNSLKPDIYENAGYFFTSDLSRTYDTGKILMDYINHKPDRIKKTELIKEKHYGDLTHMGRRELEFYYNSDDIRLWRRDYFGKPPNGESMEEVYNRVLIFYDMFLKECFHKICHFPEGKNKIIIISHGTPIRCLMSIIENKIENYYEKLEIPFTEGYYYKMTYDLRIIEKRSLPNFELLETNLVEQEMVTEKNGNKDSIIKMGRRRSSSL